MDPEPLDFSECLKDSPKFRQSLKDNLLYVENLENSMSKTLKHISHYIETGRDHLKSQNDFICSLRTLIGSLGLKDFKLASRVTILLNALEEIRRLNEIVIDQSARTISASLTNFINDDLLKVKEARKSFDKISHDYDVALIKHSQPVKKQQDDCENLLIATSTAFTHTSLDLSILLTSVQSRKNFEILSSLLSLTKAHSTFFHEGSDLFEELRPNFGKTEQLLNDMQDEFEILTRSLPSKHLMVSNNELHPICFDNKAERVQLEGYLFKRASNGFKVWNRRWFMLKNHQLSYQRRGDVQPIVMEEDLRLLTVKAVDKAETDRRYCFEILSPHKSHILQADSESACKTWIAAIQAGINAAFHETDRRSVPKLANSAQYNSEDLSESEQGAKVDEQGRTYTALPDKDDYDNDCAENYAGSSSGSNSVSPSLKPPMKPKRAYKIILEKPGNNKCADCNAPEPKWASINLGITLCIECAGIHRSLGVHLSKVRSLTLDTEVWSPQIINLMLSLGNNSVNAAYLASYRGQIAEIDSESGHEQRKNWIKAKYLLKRFMRPPDAEASDESVPNSPDKAQVSEKRESAESESEAEADSAGARCPSNSVTE